MVRFKPYLTPEFISHARKYCIGAELAISEKEKRILELIKVKYVSLTEHDRTDEKIIARIVLATVLHRDSGLKFPKLYEADFDFSTLSQSPSSLLLETSEMLRSWGFRYTVEYDAAYKDATQKFKFVPSAKPIFYQDLASGEKSLFDLAMYLALSYVLC